jgi:hypothetical protein
MYWKGSDVFCVEENHILTGESFLSKSIHWVQVKEVGYNFTLYCI